MRNLRLSVILLISYLTFFYNIERLDFAETNVIDVPSFIYLYGTVAVLSIIAIPFFYRASRYSNLLIWGMIYIGIRYTLAHERPIIGGIHTYIFITEATLITATLILSHNVARNMHDFEEAVENITFGQIRSRVRSLEEAQVEIKTEMLRSRRYQRPISIITVRIDPHSVNTALHRAIQEVQRSMMERYVFLGLARLITRQTRRMDILVEQEQRERLIVLCPETDAAGAMNTLGRIQRAAREKLGLSVFWGIASFPSEALTFEDLLKLAEKQLALQKKQASSTESSSTATNATTSNTKTPKANRIQDT